jgi:Arc/MetJ-type ribon-helix-helix transcriptional regulator
MSDDRYYNRRMPRSISFRADDQVEAALEQLTKDGSDRSNAIRQAIMEAAERQTREEARAEAAALAADPEDRAEMARVQTVMASLRAW